MSLIVKRQAYFGIRMMSMKPKILDITTKVLKNDDPIKFSDEKYISHPLFPHPEFTDKQCETIKVEHRIPKTFSDKIAFNSIQLIRKTFDFWTGYSEDDRVTMFRSRKMTELKWITRVIFLESIAGVPGMVGAFLRHLHSLRLLRRDKAWVETLLDEAYNERMHLLTFIKIGKPSWFTRFFIFMGQGVFTNIFFFLYLANPKICHRIVGYLEEEAVRTYTHLITELKQNKLPGFNNMKIPTIAWEYWTELTPQSSFLDLVERVRADEAKHREVNHTFANLNTTDRNPFALRIEGLDKPQPGDGLVEYRGTGWERKDLDL